MEDEWVSDPERWWELSGGILMVSLVSLWFDRSSDRVTTVL